MLIVLLIAIFVGVVCAALYLLLRRYKRRAPGKIEKIIWRVIAVLSLLWPVFVIISGFAVMKAGFVLFDFVPVYGWEAFANYVVVTLVFGFVPTALSLGAFIISVGALILAKKYESKPQRNKGNG